MTEDSALARVRLILLFVWNTHAAVIERKYLKGWKNVTMRYNIWQEGLKMDVTSTNCSAQRASVEGGQITVLYRVYSTFVEKFHTYTMLVRAN